MGKITRLNNKDNKYRAGRETEDTVFGLGGNDEIDGRDFDDKLDGGKGDDVLKGGEGDDFLIGGAGTDFLFGSKGFDIAFYDESKAGVTVSFVDPSRGTGDAKGDQFNAVEGLVGSAHGDTLSGNALDNSIWGGRGDDVIDGGGGNDELWGDDNEFGVDGADTFVFAGPADTDLKLIMDFDVQDHIEISRSGFGLHIQYQLTVGSTLIIAHASPTATTNSPTFLVEQSTGNLYFDADGNGSGAAELIANVQFHSQQFLDINDFVIV